MSINTLHRILLYLNILSFLLNSLFKVSSIKDLMGLCVVSSIVDLAISLLIPHLSINFLALIGHCLLDDATQLIVYPQDPSIISYDQLEF